MCLAPPGKLDFPATVTYRKTWRAVTSSGLAVLFRGSRTCLRRVYTRTWSVTFARACTRGKVPGISTFTTPPCEFTRNFKGRCGEERDDGGRWILLACELTYCGWRNYSVPLEALWSVKLYPRHFLHFHYSSATTPLHSFPFLRRQYIPSTHGTEKSAGSGEAGRRDDGRHRYLTRTACFPLAGVSFDRVIRKGARPVTSL